MATNLFIYGTLRKEAKSHVKPIRSLGLDSIEGKIYNINGHYPGYKRGEGKVIGEIVEIDENNLELIDAYEGQDYRRIKIISNSGIESWVYEFLQDVSNYQEIKSGDWLNKSKVSPKIDLANRDCMD